MTFDLFRAVHRTFFTRDGHHIASFSDDKTVSLWDISSQQISGHYEGYHMVNILKIKNMLCIDIYDPKFVV